MIKNIIFDMGNVLMSYNPKEMLKHYTNKTYESELLLNEIFQSVEWLQFDRGIIDKDTLKLKISERVPESLRQMSIEVLDNWYQYVSPIEQMGDVIDTLKEENFNVYLLSNASSDFYLFKNRIPRINKFDGIFLSSDWKMLKPEKEIYQSFYAYFDLNPAECFFIDDMVANIESAKLTGMEGYIFKQDFEQLISVLNSI